jgi:hypothetical protein
MVFDKQDIKNFLNDKHGYRNEGKNRLHSILTARGIETTIEACAEALAEHRKENEESDQIVAQVLNADVPTDFEMVSKWQGASGEWLASYKKKKEASGEAWGIFRTNLLEELEGVKKPDITPTNPSGDMAMEVSLPDLHFGKGDTEELYEEFMQSLRNLVGKIQIERVDRFILPIGNDGLNSEGLRATTTAGTPQFDSAPWYETFAAYSRALIDGINFLQSIAPVDVVVVQGNHDYERMFYMGEMISAYYRNNKNVKVDNSPEPRKYYKYGHCLLMYTHGDKEKAADMPLIMATEQPMLFAETKHREVHCGHFHKEMLNEYRGVKVRFLPSICTTDDWHKQQGYEHYRCAQAFLWSAESGLEGFIQDNK